MEITIQHLSTEYNGEPCLQDVSLTIERGSIFALVGPNGCGKTTLLKHISGVLSTEHSLSSIFLDGKELSTFSTRELARSLAAVEQHVSTGFNFSVRDIVSMGRIPHLSRWQSMGAADRKAVEKALEQTEISHLSHRSVFQLSSGERQRVWLAMALAQEPAVLLLDEPTSHLDLRFQIEIFDILEKLAACGITVVVAIHDMNLTLLYAHCVALLKQGEIIATGLSSEVLTAENIHRVFEIRMKLIHDPISGQLVGLIPQRGRGI